MKLVSAVPVDDGSIECPSPEYLAGYFDGEGSIFVQSRARNVRAGHRFKTACSHFEVGINLCNTHRSVLDAVALKYGGRVRSNKNHLQPNTRQAWYWTCFGQPLSRFLTDIEPHLVEKRRKVVAALFFLDTMRWPYKWRELSDEQLLVRRAALRYFMQNPNQSKKAVDWSKRVVHCAS